MTYFAAIVMADGTELQYSDIIDHYIKDGFFVLETDKEGYTNNAVFPRESIAWIDVVDEDYLTGELESEEDDNG